MLALNYTQSLLNLQEVIVKKVITTKESTVIDIEMPMEIWISLRLTHISTSLLLLYVASCAPI